MNWLIIHRRPHRGVVQVGLPFAFLTLLALASCQDAASRPDSPELPTSTDVPDEALVKVALEDSAEDERIVAVLDLVARTTIVPTNPTRKHLRHICRDTDDPEVRAAAIAGIAQGWDYDGMEDVLDGLDDPSLEVREQAAISAQRMIGLRFPYRASDSAKKRSVVVQHMRSIWSELQSSGRLEQWLVRLKNGEGG